MRRQPHKTTILLTSEEVEFLDDVVYDFKKTSGVRVSKTGIIRAAINYLHDVDEAYRYAIIKARIPNEDKKGPQGT